MCQAASHHPRSGALHIEERRCFLPPPLLRASKNLEASGAVRSVLLDERDPRFGLRERRRVHIDAEHLAKPDVLAHALMDHLFAHAAPSWIVTFRSYQQILVSELAPDADHFDSLGFIAVDEKVVTSWLHDHPLFCIVGPVECSTGGRLRKY